MVQNWAKHIMKTQNNSKVNDINKTSFDNLNRKLSNQIKKKNN